MRFDCATKSRSLREETVYAHFACAKWACLLTQTILSHFSYIKIKKSLKTLAKVIQIQYNDSNHKECARDSPVDHTAT